MTNLVRTLKDLIAVKSITGSPESYKIIDYVETFFKGTKAYVKKYERPGNKPSVVISNVPGLSFDLIMSGHLDVVPADDHMFIPKEKDGKIFGRGSCDMKISIAVMMEIMKDLLKAGSEKRIALMLTTDEEVGGEEGVGYLVDVVGYRAKAVFMPDSGTDIRDVIVVNKGVIHLKIVSTGKSAHCSRPWEGDNAIHNLLEVCEKIAHYVEKIPYKNAKQKFDDKAGKKWRNTCVLSRISAGTATNQVPNVAEAHLDIRFTEGNKLDDLIKGIKKVAKGHNIEIATSAEATYTPLNNQYLKNYIDAVKEIIRKKPRLIRYYGANDGPHFSKHGVPVIAARSNSGGQHSEGEWADIKSMHDFYKICSRFIEKLN